MDTIARTCAQSSVLRNYMVVKGLIKFYMEMSPELEKAYKAIKRPKVKRKLPEVLSEEEVIDIVRSIMDPRFKLFFALAYETGAHRSELLSLKV